MFRDALIRAFDDMFEHLGASVIFKPRHSPPFSLIAVVKEPENPYEIGDSKLVQQVAEVSVKSADVTPRVGDFIVTNGNMNEMNALIAINYDDDRPTVSGRDLHKALQIRTNYKDWFPRMIEYGFTEGKDFSSFLSESTGGRPAVDHQISISMAKQLCMIQRTAVGRKCREYFISIEEAWNSPEKIMERALKFANKQAIKNMRRIRFLEDKIDELEVS